MDRNSVLCITKLVNEILIKDEMAVGAPQFFSPSVIELL